MARARHVPPPPLGPLPQSPSDFDGQALPLVRLDRSWERMHACAYGAIYFNRKNTGRFNAPDEEYGVMYMGGDMACCFVETFGRLDTPAGTTVRSVSEMQLINMCISTIRSLRPLALVDLTGPGLRRIGADARLIAGDYRESQRWGLALWAHPNQPDGILYPARHDPSLQSVALFDRARDAVEAGASHALSTLNDADLAALLDRYNFSLRP